MEIFKRKSSLIILTLVCLALLSGCAGALPVKNQAYAKLKNQRTFEYDFPDVWKGIEESLRNHRIIDRDPKEVDLLEMRKLSRRSLETDWVYGQSQDKYIEYKVNNLPRKTYLQTRFKYRLIAQKTLGGVIVTVNIDEEVEKLKSNGSSAGYGSSGEPDSNRSNDLLEKINRAILAAPPTQMP